MSMQKLNVRFDSSTKDCVAKLAESMDLFDSSVARAAMNIGLKAIAKEQGCSSRTLYDWIEDNQCAQLEEK